MAINKGQFASSVIVLPRFQIY